MRRWVGVGAVAVALVLTLSACGDAEGPDDGAAQGGPCEVDADADRAR